MAKNPQIIIYTTLTCHFCDMAKELLEERGYTFETVDLTHDPEGRLALIEKAGGQKTVPQIFMNGRHMGGYEDLKRLVQDGTL